MERAHTQGRGEGQRKAGDHIVYVTKRLQLSAAHRLYRYLGLYIISFKSQELLVHTHTHWFTRGPVATNSVRKRISPCTGNV